MVLDLIKGFFCIYWDDQEVFVFGSVNVVYYVYWFSYVEPPLHSWDEAYLVVVNDLFDVSLNSVCHYFIEDFCINVQLRRLAYSCPFWMKELSLIGLVVCHGVNLIKMCWYKTHQTQQNKPLCGKRVEK
jgi:hypothetical protein